MKIVQVMASSGGIGGLEQHTFNLVNELAQNNEVHIITHPCYASNFDSRVTFHPVDFSRSRFNPMLIWQLKKIIRQIQPDIIHTQAGKAAELISKIRLNSNTALVSTVHGTKKSKQPYLSADAIIVVSKALAEGLPLDKVEVIYNGILPHHTLNSLVKQKLYEDITAQHPYLNTDLPLLICIGRLEPVKNISLLLNAIKDISANLLIVGDGSQRKILEQKAKHLAIDQQVAFLGFRTDARDLIQLSDIVVMSSDREGFPLVMVEALQAQKPMISTRVNGVTEWIPNDYLAPIGDEKSLHRIINSSLQQDIAKDFLPLFIRAQHELTVTAMTQKTEDVYRKVLNQSKSSH